MQHNGSIATARLACPSTGAALGDVYLPAGEVEKKEYVIGHQTGRCPDLGGETVGGNEQVHVQADKFRPRRGLLALWSWGNAMAFEHVAHGLSADRIAQMGQDTSDPIITPRAVLLGHADHQGLQLVIHFGAPGGLTLRGAIGLLGDQLAVPREDGVGCDDCGHLGQCLLSQPLPDLGEGLALPITQPHTPWDLLAQEPIFCHEILLAQQELVIHSARDIR